MKLHTAVDWLTWGTLVLPLFVLAWSAWQYVALQKREAARQRFDNFFRVLELIGAREGSLAAKAGAVYELRNYPEYAEMIVRFCREAQDYVSGDAAQILRTEFQLTVAHFEKSKND